MENNNLDEFKVDQSAYTVEPAQSEPQNTPENTPETGPWRVFAIIGMALGIAAIVFGFIGLIVAFASDFDIDTSLPEEEFITAASETMVGSMFMACFGLEFGIPGLVLSILGKKSQSNRGKAKVGMILSIISCAISIVAIIVVAAMFGLAIASIAV